MVGRMESRRRPAGAQRSLALSMLAVLAVVLAALRAGCAFGMCIVVRLNRAIAGCVPAWSADRAPPSIVRAERSSTALP